MNGRLRAAVTDWPTSNQRLKSLLSVSASAIGRLGDLGDKDEPGRSGDRLLSWGEQRAWAIYSNGRGQRSRDRETKGGRTGAMGDWAKGEGDSTLLASASAHLPGAGKGPLSAFRLRATRLHGRAERVCHPGRTRVRAWRRCPATCQVFNRPHLFISSLAAVSLHSERRAFNSVFSQDSCKP